MPKENKKRGRRVESNKRKHEDDNVDPHQHDSSSSKRRKSIVADIENDHFIPLDVADEDLSAAYPGMDKAFFGVLDQEEQEYFKHADEMLEMDSFPSPEERALFLESVYREAAGKELKIAQSQSCSRLMERLIQLSTAAQLKVLFQKFSGKYGLIFSILLKRRIANKLASFMHLISHRFASHCCEALFTRAAPFVSAELLSNPRDEQDSDDINGIYVTMENLFLHTLAEFEGNLGYLLTDRFASHTLRILLLVFSGQPLSSDSMKSLIQSKKKEDVTVTMTPNQADETPENPRVIPESFSTALEKLLDDSVAGLDTDKLRAFATHPAANPSLQLLLKLEVSHYGKQRAKDEHSIIRKLLPDDPLTAESESAAFLSGLVYDPVGSHLVEKIIENAPAKLFKILYNTLFKERLASYARNEVATYVDCRIIERLGQDDLLEAHEKLVPIIPSLLERNWTSLLRTLIERCTVREVDTQAIAVHIDQYFTDSDGFDVKKLLKLDQQPGSNGDGPSTNGSSAHKVLADDPFPSRASQPIKVHFNVLAQAMLMVPGSLSALILDSLVGLKSATLLNMAHDPIVSRTLQTALTTKHASIIQRRKLVQHFYGHMGDMALDKSASHVMDHIWEGTHGLAFIRERVAEELAENETELRESLYGRAVWKNWKMDIYKRRRADWVRQSKIKASNDGFQTFSEIDAKRDKDGSAGPHKTPLQLARERHAQGKVHRDRRPSNRSVGGGGGTPAETTWTAA